MQVDWFTLYGIGQCTAAMFKKGRVLLAGDSSHTHSVRGPAGVPLTRVQSGSAQGLNTGTQDAVNLAWKVRPRLSRF